MADEQTQVDPTFTQEDVNRFLADDRRKNDSKYKKSNQKLLDELSALKGRAELSASERTELDERIEQLQSQLMTKEELTKRDREKFSKKYEKDLNEAVTSSNYWKNQFTESTIAGAITGKSVEFGVQTPQHMVAILRPNTRLVEVLSEDGKPTGKYSPMVKLSDVDEKGKPVTLDLPVSDAIKRMKEMDQHRNLFKSMGTGGLGANTHSSGKTLDIAALAKNNPEEYRRLRKAGKIKIL